ncbi:symplekin isoform X2 [Telopea speciosissima]|uniref:symplekin isoform X2 n=1 Tax=Telopea speciosissima TaxID=54955 RepID=UPI001CC5DD5B|nr:symplekin isoform X2 [Telopea speciosissima]
MVGRMGIGSREKAASLLHSAKFAMDIPSKLEHLHQLKEFLLQRDPSLLPEFVPQLLEFQNDRFSPVRKFLAGMIDQLGMEHIEFLPEMVPVLIAFLKDTAPAVARQAITSGTDLFCRTLEKVAIQGLCSSELDSSLESSWDSMLKFKDIVYPIAFQTGNDGIRLLGVKFVEAMILLYTPDPDGPSEPPPYQAYEGNVVGFNMSWLRGGHPMLNIGDLSIEASRSLGLLLGQLRFPTVKSLSNAIIIVLINSLSAIAKKRPAFYGRILPVLLGLDLSSSVIKGVRFCGAHHALKNAFVSCLKCTHPGAAPWRDRLVGALREMKAGVSAEQTVCEVGKFNGIVEDGAGEAYSIEERKPSMESLDDVHIETGKKRSAQEISDLVQDDGLSTKRVRPTPIVSQSSTKDSNAVQDNLPSTGSTASAGDGDSGPVQQLLAMFGALVAQGEKAAGSLEILISSISADLLAEVVMANMCYLPATRPKAEGDDESMLNTGYITSTVGSNTQGIQPSSFVSNVFSLSSAFPQIARLLSAQPSTSRDADKSQRGNEHQAVVATDTAAVSSSINDLTEAVRPTEVVVSTSAVVPSKMEDCSAIPPEAHDMGNFESGIPGLDSSVYTDGLLETLDTSRLSSADIQGTNQEEVTSLDSSPLNFPSTGSTPVDRSEELNPNSTTHTTATSVHLSSQYVLPKMSAPVVDLDDEQKDYLQKSAFLHIIEAYKQVKVAGGTHVRFSLLACLGMEYPLELDPWKLLQKHILSDYLNHEGHELTLRVLFRLFGEAEQDRDFFSSTTATSVYETFLLTVAETLRDSFPASDKSLTRLLGEVPYLPKTAYKFLECLCCPGSNEKVDKELQSGDRVTQGLSTVWSLILLRPPIRDICLKIALQSAVHHLEEVRMKAIRLVANKLYPLSCIAQQIEDFANDMLLSVMNGPNVTEGVDAEGSIIEGPKDSDLENPPNELAVSNVTKEVASDSTCSSILDAQRCMSLYFALCTKKHSLFRRIFVIYKSLPKGVKQAVHRHIPILVRTMGSSSELLGIISDPPTGCENLLIQVLHTLTDGTIPSPELILTVRKLYESKLKDVEILIPILPSLSKDEVLSIFPQLINLPPDKFQAVLARILQGSSHFGPALTPAEVLIAIHGIDPERDGIPLKKVTDACNACFEQRQVFTQQVLARVLNQLVEQIPLPLLFMRTVLQAIGAFPALVDFIMEILSRLVNKQIWKYPKLWVGFLKCTALTKPHSFSVLLQLPAAQLENALNRTPALKAPLITHANQPNIRTSLPRSILVVLGIAQDSQSSSHTQMVQPQTTDTSNSGAEAVTEKNKESSTVS